MARIVVIGGSSGTGLACVIEALQRGHEVVMFSRSAQSTELTHPSLQKVAGNALSTNDVDDVVRGADAVIQALGVPMNLQLITGPITLFSQSTEILLPALSTHGVRRLVVLTGFGSGDSKSAISALQKPGFNLAFGRAYADKSEQEAMIKGADVDWTLARPGVLRNGEKTGKYQVLLEPSSWRNGIIRRADVANFMVDAAESRQYLHQAPVLISHGLLPFT